MNALSESLGVGENPVHQQQRPTSVEAALFRALRHDDPIHPNCFVYVLIPPLIMRISIAVSCIQSLDKERRTVRQAIGGAEYVSRHAEIQSINRQTVLMFLRYFSSKSNLVKDS
jgi:hypothetical protein